MRSLINIKAVTIGILFLFAQHGHALVEVRAHYGLGTTPAEEYNAAYFKLQDGPELTGAKVLGVDLLVSPPMFNLGIGLRVEAAKEEDSAFATDVKMAYTRTSLLLNYRLIDTLFFAGPIASVGLKHRFEMAIPTDPEKISSESATSYSLGFEGGAQLGIILIGAEVGYQSLKFKSFKEIDGSPWDNNGITISQLDMSGMYYKVMLGVGF